MNLDAILPPAMLMNSLFSSNIFLWLRRTLNQSCLSHMGQDGPSLRAKGSVYLDGSS